MRFESSILICILLVALMLRLIACLQYSFIDEAYILNNIFNFFGNRTFMPTQVVYPTLFSYLASVPTALGAVLLYWVGQLPSPTDFPSLYKLESLLVYFPARSVNVFFGVCTVFLVYKIGKSFFCRSTGLLAAVIMCLCEDHIARSSLALPDVTMCFFATCSLWFSLSALTSKKIKDFVFAGLFGVLTIATKFNGIFITIPIVAAQVINSLEEKQAFSWKMLIDKRLRYSAYACIAAFFIVSPAWLTNPVFLFSGVAFQMEQNKVGLIGQYGTPWLHEVQTLLGREPAIAVLFMLGLIYAFVYRDKQNIFLLSLIVPSFLYISGVESHRLYLLLFIYPALSLLAARMLVKIIDRLCQRKLHWVVGLVLLIALIEPVLSAAKQASDELKQQDNRWVAYQWIQKHIPDSSRIIIDKYPTFGPLLYTHEQKAELLSGAHKHFFEEKIGTIRTYVPTYIQYQPNWLKKVEADYLVTSSYSSSVFTETVPPQKDNSNYTTFSQGKETYSALLGNSEELGWKLIERFTDGKGPKVLVFRRRYAASLPAPNNK